ncbi:MAG: DUF3168 domain-containing protein [Sphaerochaetaceae bacterium]
MSFISIAVQDLLKADTAVKAIVGNRVYPDGLPRINDADPTLPAITVSEVSDIPDRAVLCQRAARIQVSCWSNPAEYNGVKSPQEVETLAEAVITAMQHSNLTVYTTTLTVATKRYYVYGMSCINALRMRDPVTDFYHKPCDFEILYRKLED